MAGEKIARTYHINNQKLVNFLIAAADDTEKHYIKKIKKNDKYLQENAHIIAGQIIMMDKIKKWTKQN